MSSTLDRRLARAARLPHAILRRAAVCAALLCLAGAAAAAPAHSRQPWPLNGTYQVGGLRVCGNNEPAGSGGVLVPTLIRTETAQFNFTPAGKQPFAEWVAEIGAGANPATEPPGWQGGTTSLANAPNPASPDTLLSETAVEWGQLDMANFRSEIGAPGAAVSDTLQTGPTWFFVTQYGYGEGVALDTFAAGYAVYVWRDDTESWQRYVMNLNSRLTFTAAAASGHSAYQKDINGVAYHCLRQIRLHQ